MVGKSQDAAPINREGVVLSHPISNTTPSSGLPRIDSSTSMLARFRNSIAVGRSKTSPSDITGNSSGNPPASHTPFFTQSAISRKCALHGVSSDHVLQIPITGLPLNKSCGQPWFLIQLRYMKPILSCRTNHSWLRSFFISVLTRRLPVTFASRPILLHRRDLSIKLPARLEISREFLRGQVRAYHLHRHLPIAQNCIVKRPVVHLPGFHQFLVQSPKLQSAEH